MKTTLKTCFKCLTEKPLSEYYKHKGMSDGHLNKCKDCAKSDVKKHRSENDSVREYDRNRGNRQDGSYLKSYRSKYPNKYKAHNMVNNSLRDGLIIKPDNCEGCGKPKKLNAHHDDYLKPLEVIWFCHRCHSLHHAEHGEALNAF